MKSQKPEEKSAAIKAGSISAVERYGTVIIIKVSVASLFYPFYFCFYFGKKIQQNLLYVSLSLNPPLIRS